MNDDRNRSWPSQEPDAPRRARRPQEDPGPAWPADDAPRRPAPPRRPPAGGPRPPRAPRAEAGPEWPSGDEGAPQWPAADEPRRPQRPPQNRAPQGRPPQGPAPQDRGSATRASQILDGQGAPPPRRQPPVGRPGPNGGPNGGPAGNGTQGFRQPPPGGRPPQGRRVPPPPPPPSYPETDREPDLITHAAHNGYAPYDDRYDDHDPYDEETRLAQYSDDADFEDEPEGEEDGKKNKTPLSPMQRRKRRWKIVRRVLYAMFGLFVVVPAIAFVITYFLVDVPSPQDVLAKQSQPITFYYGDKSVMGKVVPQGGNRELLQPNQIPEVVKHAVYSAEDASFETNSGFNVMAILRSVFNQATGGTGGGSTISQQYIKQATKNDAPTLTRKWTELAKSFKLNNETSKSDIITGYLNIVFFGRGANGIAAASKAYFGKDVKDLNASEAALLAGMIQGPSRDRDTAYVQKRWSYVMDQMVANHWLSPADRKAAQLPTMIPRDAQKKEDAGTLDYFIQQRILDELKDKGYDEDKLYSTGAKIYTTIDPNAQKLAVQSVQDNMQGQTDENLRGALVAVDPRTGGVLAYYGGPTTVKNSAGKDVLATDWANTPQNPGSSMKAYDLTAWLKMGKGLGEVFDGTNNRELGGRVVRNAGESASCGPQCTVKKAMEVSANTVFYDMVLNWTKPARVAEAAKEAGVQSAPKGKAKLGTSDANIALGGGATVVTPEDMAAGYSSFASGGVRRDQHFVAKLTNSQDEVIFDDTAGQAKPAFDDNADKSKQIAGNVTDALGPVIAESHLKCPSGHECAGKTGTQQYDPQDGDPSSYKDRNAQTWMVGYTPSVSAAVWIGGDGNKPLHDQDGNPIFGKTIAGPAWQDFLTNYLKDKPSEKFDKVDPIGKDADEVVTSSKTAPPPRQTSSEQPPPPPTTSSSSEPPPSTSSHPPSSTTTSPTRPGGIFGGGTDGGNPGSGGGPVVNGEPPRRTG